MTTKSYFKCTCKKIVTYRASGGRAVEIPGGMKKCGTILSNVNICSCDACFQGWFDK